jgi:hypothetical protein
MEIRTISAASLATILTLSTVAGAVARTASGQESASPSTLERVRVLDPDLRRPFDRGMSESPTIVDLVGRLERSDALVYLAQGPCPAAYVVACVVSVNQEGGSRYIRINFVLVRQAQTTALRGSAERLVAQIGHELQHAVEIADDPSIVDAPSLERAYQRRGAYRNSAGYETDAALQAGEAVLRDLTRDNTLAARKTLKHRAP